MMNLTANDIVVIAGVAITAIAAVGTALVIESARLRALLLSAVFVVVGAGILLYVHAQQTTGEVIRARVAEEVNRLRRDDQSFETAVQEEVRRRLLEEQRERTAVEQEATERVVRAEAEQTVRRRALEEEEFRRKAAEAAAIEERNREAREERRRLAAVQQRMIGTWERKRFGSHEVVEFREDGTCDHWRLTWIDNYARSNDSWITCKLTGEDRATVRHVAFQNLSYEVSFTEEGFLFFEPTNLLWRVGLLGGQAYTRIAPT